MEKQVRMVAEFDILTENQKVRDILDDEGNLDIGGFYFHDKKQQSIPFDFAATGYNVEGSTVSFFSGEGPFFREYDIDYEVYEDEYNSLGYTNEDLTASFFADTPYIEEFFVGLYDKSDEPVPFVLKLKEISFLDSDSNVFSVDKKTLIDFNRRELARQISEYLHLENSDYFEKFCYQVLNDSRPVGTLDIIGRLDNRIKNLSSDVEKKEGILYRKAVLELTKAKENIYSVSLTSAKRKKTREPLSEPVFNVPSVHFYGENKLECQMAVMNYIQKYILSSKEFAGGVVKKGDICEGFISYNGRFWDKNNNCGVFYHTVDELLGYEKQIPHNAIWTKTIVPERTFVQEHVMDISSKMYESVKSMDHSSVKKYLEQGADVNFKVPVYGYTPLHIASYYADLKMMDLLVSAGANVNALSADGKTPLDLALERHGTPKVIDFLETHDGKPGIQIEKTLESEIYEDLKTQIVNHENETFYGEPQAWVELPNGRCIEVVLKQEGLAKKEYYFSVRLHCTVQEFENDQHHSTMGVVWSDNTKNSDIHEVKKLLPALLRCNDAYPVEEMKVCDSSLDEMIEKAGDSVRNKVKSSGKVLETEHQRI